MAAIEASTVVEKLAVATAISQVHVTSAGALSSVGSFSGGKSYAVD